VGADRWLRRLSSHDVAPCIPSGNLKRVTRVGPVLVVVAVCAVSGTTIPLAVQAQSEESRPAQTLDTIEMLLGWPAPDPELTTDVRVMTRSALSIAPLPLIRLTGGEDNHVTATVTEWGAPDVGHPDGRPLFFKYLPLACADDRSICAGTPRVIRTPEAKALWFALFIARSCNDRPRKSISDAEDLFVRGRVGGIPMTFSCRGPNPRGASPGDRQAAAVLRMSRRLVGR
jgi:hypothetical protein